MISYMHGIEDGFPPKQANIYFGSSQRHRISYRYWDEIKISA